MNNLYPSELRTIANLVEAYQDFAEKVTTMDRGDVDWEWDGELSFPVYNCNGEKMGRVEWTDDGVIGFVLNAESQ